jgi:hypothetical protein
LGGGRREKVGREECLSTFELRLEGFSIKRRRLCREERSERTGTREMLFTDDGIGREVTSGDNSLTECVDILFFGRHDLFDGWGEREVTPHEGDSWELFCEFL